MKQYLLSVCYPAGSTQPAPDAMKKIMQDVKAVNAQMQDAGAWVFGGGLLPPNTATVLRHQGGDVVPTDGPFIESKEQIGGISVIRAPDLDAALEWARKLARPVERRVEIRRPEDRDAADLLLALDERAIRGDDVSGLLPDHRRRVGGMKPAAEHPRARRLHPLLHGLDVLHDFSQRIGWRLRAARGVTNRQQVRFHREPPLLSTRRMARPRFDSVIRIPPLVGVWLIEVGEPAA